jgi:hypothetical protein
MLRKIILVAIASLATSLGIAVGTGWGSHNAGSRHVFDARVGDSIIIRAVDLYCKVYRRDPERRETGPLMYCRRDSSYQATRAIGASRNHFFVTSPKGDHVVYEIVRGP